MKKQLLIPALALVALAVCAAPKKSDPVVMTVAGKDIHQSEFQYLYEKNNRQQLAPQSLEEYVDMFVVYKLKVADAEAAGIDTKTVAFVLSISITLLAMRSRKYRSWETMITAPL